MMVNLRRVDLKHKHANLKKAALMARRSGTQEFQKSNDKVMTQSDDSK